MAIHYEGLETALLKLGGGLTIEQIVGLRRFATPNAARRGMVPLTAAGLVAATPTRLPLMEPLDVPLAEWRPGERTPHLGRICHLAAQRGKGARKATTIYSATPTLARLYGAPLPAAKTNNRIHDLILGEVYLAYERGRSAIDWVNEAEIARMYRGHSACPDAGVSDGDGGLLQAIEVVGLRYRPERLARLVGWADALGIPIEFW